MGAGAQRTDCKATAPVAEGGGADGGRSILESNTAGRRRGRHRRGEGDQVAVRRGIGAGSENGCRGGELSHIVKPGSVQSHAIVIGVHRRQHCK